MENNIFLDEIAQPPRLPYLSTCRVSVSLKLLQAEMEDA